MSRSFRDQEPYAEYDEATRRWRDEHGRLGPVKPGLGPRQDPVGTFPTGPEVGTPLPDIAAPTHDGRTIDVHVDRAGRPAVVVFYRSAVW